MRAGRKAGPLVKILDTTKEGFGFLVIAQFAKEIEVDFRIIRRNTTEELVHFCKSTIAHLLPHRLQETTRQFAVKLLYHILQMIKRLPHGLALAEGSDWHIAREGAAIRKGGAE